MDAGLRVPLWVSGLWPLASCGPRHRIVLFQCRAAIRVPPWSLITEWLGSRGRTLVHHQPHPPVAQHSTSAEV